MFSFIRHVVLAVAVCSLALAALSARSGAGAPDPRSGARDTVGAGPVPARTAGEAAGHRPRGTDATLMAVARPG